MVIEQSGNALVADVDSTNLDTGTLTVSIPAGDARAEDVLGICNQGTGAGQIGVSGAEVTYQGVTIGTFTGGSSGSNLVITFNASATPTAVTDLVKNITYQDTDTNAPTTGARTVRYVLTDGDGGTSANYDTTVTVSGVNDAPTDLALSANTVAENAPNGTVVGTASTTDPDAGDTHTYQLTDTAGGRFAINASTGQIIVADGSLLDYESAASHNITVQTTDAGGLTHDQSFTITLTNVNEAPTLVGWYNSAWAYRKEITIDHTQVAANQNDFAVLVNLGADADVQAHALANGNDIVFTAADGVTKLNAQIEKYSSVNGELVAWVRVPSLSSVTDTRLFLYYGDPAASNQQNAAGVWDAHTTAVYHLNESGGPYSDSTGNANAGSAIGTPAQT
ncbi:MAG: DUF2341 domain-containing protein, partial [Gammaproteobacteria bacterium]|nr:DUF2341 domain-containing protein [Gammaproteobacteria bacterium]